MLRTLFFTITLEKMALQLTRIAVYLNLIPYFNKAREVHIVNYVCRYSLIEVLHEGIQDMKVQKTDYIN